MTHLPAILVASMTLLASCSEGYAPLSFTADGDRAIATGVIDRSTPDSFEKFAAQHPDIRTLVLQNIGGSVDDEANLIFSRQVRALGFTTIVPSDGMVASGGTDLFLAGAQRILEPGACVGVHSWSGGDVKATDLPRNHPEHMRYLSYYRDIGIEPAFYWFTLDAAPAEGIHWMTATEAGLFSMTTVLPPQLGTTATCDSR